MFQICDEDIKNVERLLLPENATFCEESRIFICAAHSVDVQACPGSGKTTALLAKLLILASRLPLPNNAGICILTHTNTAINEVKRRFGQQANKLFQYPNFVGTIQSFVNKFLATPAFVEAYGKRPVTIDDGQFYFEIQRSQGTDIRKAKYALEQRHIELKNLRFSFDSFVVSKSLNDDVSFMDAQTPTYIAIEKHKRMVLEKGYLCFDDAYALANRHLTNHNNIGELFAKRFRYVFIDEMQDTDVHQCRVLNAIFQPEKTVVQCIGDQNQAIYSYDVHESLVWKPNANMLRINGSKRFSKSIAQAIKGVGLEPQDLVGYDNTRAIKPKLLFFDDEQITQVIPYFCTLIEKYNLQSVALNPVFKAVGWTGKEYDDDNSRVGKHRIGDYFPQYSNERMKKKLAREHLSEYLAIDSRIANLNSSKVYRDAIIEAILRYLAINNAVKSDGRSFTSSKLLDFLQEGQKTLFDLLMLNLAKWVRHLVAGKDIHDELMHFLINELSKCQGFGLKFDRAATSEFFSRSTQSAIIEPAKEESKENLVEGIPLVVDTVHAVKGETHTATLYLETFNKGYDVSRIFEYFQPDLQRGKLTSTQKQTLKIAYVAMSRPTHLLCVAVHKNTPDAYKKHLRYDIDQVKKSHEDYWDVIEIPTSY